MIERPEWPKTRRSEGIFRESDSDAFASSDLGPNRKQ